MDHIALALVWLGGGSIDNVGYPLSVYLQLSRQSVQKELASLILSTTQWAILGPLYFETTKLNWYVSGGSQGTRSSFRKNGAI